MLRAFLLFAVTAAAEIFGCYAVYLWLRWQRTANPLFPKTRRPAMVTDN